MRSIRFRRKEPPATESRTVSPKMVQRQRRSNLVEGGEWDLGLSFHTTSINPSADPTDTRNTCLATSNPPCDRCSHLLLDCKGSRWPFYRPRTSSSSTDQSRAKSVGSNERYNNRESASGRLGGIEEQAVTNRC